LKEGKRIIKIDQNTKKLNNIAQKLYENHKELNIVAERNFFEKKFLPCAICYKGVENKYLSRLLKMIYPDKMTNSAILDILKRRRVHFLFLTFTVRL
jgi:superfamily II helicase